MAHEFYAGIANVLLGEATADIGDGLRFQVTFGHLFSPFMMAYQPAPKGAAHPTPWRAVSAGFATDIHAQLIIPAENDNEGRAKAFETAWLIGTLLRLRLGPHVRVATIASAPISVESARRGEGEIWALEVSHTPLIRHMQQSQVLGDDDVEWFRLNWSRAATLMRGNQSFRVLLEAYSDCSWAKSIGLALVQLWGAMQQVFTQGHQEASLRLSVLLASYLEPPGLARRKLAERIAALYGARSKGAHGGKDEDLQPLADSANIAARAITRLIEHGAVPSRDDLFDMLYGV